MKVNILSHQSDNFEDFLTFGNTFKSQIMFYLFLDYPKTTLEKYQKVQFCLHKNCANLFLWMIKFLLIFSILKSFTNLRSSI